MPTKKKRLPHVQIYSIFGQIESAAAEHMIEKHGLLKIPASKVPKDEAFNDSGSPVLFAVGIPKNLISEFEAVISGLRM